MMQKAACDSCHKRKIQCDSSGPGAVCNWCDHHGLACTFMRVRGRKKRQRKKSLVGRSFSDRLARIESALAQAITQKELIENPSTPSETPEIRIENEPLDELRNFGQGGSFSHDSTESPIPPISRCHSASPSLGPIQYVGVHLGQINCQNGMPLLSESDQKWISSRTGEPVTFGHLCSPALKSWTFHHQRVPPEKAGIMPDRSIVDRGLELFSSSAGKLVFPVVDCVLFKDTVALAYALGPGLIPHSQAGAKACVLAFLSVMWHFKSQLGEVPAVDGDLCATQARDLLSDVLKDPSLVSLQTVFMLQLYETVSGRLQNSVLLHAIACRLVFMLGGHMDQPICPYTDEATPEERARRHLRMLFWMCYIFDKDISIRTGQPPLLSDEYCDLSLPKQYSSCYFYLTDLRRSPNSHSIHEESLAPHLPGDPRLSYLKERVHRLLYSPRGLKKSEAQVLHDIRMLDDDLEAWRVSTPAQFRPMLLMSGQGYELPFKLAYPHGMRHIILHLEYYFLMSMIHRASERCYSINNENTSERIEWNSGVQSSTAISVEASRSTLVYLSSAWEGIVREAFWIVVFYPTAAIMTIFFNILRRPLDFQAETDLKLLSLASDIISRIPIEDRSVDEFEHVKVVKTLVAELVRFGECAIAKATRERLEGQNNPENKETHETLRI